MSRHFRLVMAALRFMMVLVVALRFRFKMVKLIRTCLPLLVVLAAFLSEDPELTEQRRLEIGSV